MSKKTKQEIEDIEETPKSKEFAVVIDGITSPSLVFASMDEAQQKVIILSKTRPRDIYEIIER
jgi:hypothetical protein